MIQEKEEETAMLLVTGGAGYIGSVVARQLADRKNEVIVIDNLVQGHKEAVPPEVVFVKGDIGDRQLLNDIFAKYEIDSVVHLAAETIIGYSMTNPRPYFHNNVVAGINLLDCMLENGIDRIVFSSTAAVYGEPTAIPVAEDHPQRPINAYGESKLMFERILRWYYEAYGLKYVTFRYFNVAGASGKLGTRHDPETQIIPSILQVAQGERDYIEIYGVDYDTKDGSCIRDYIHVLDIAQAHLLALDKVDEIREAIYNLGTGDGYSVIEVVETAREITGKDIVAKEAERRPGDPAVLVASSEKAKSDLGWIPKHQDLKEIIKSAWQWYKSPPF